jgi:hypothetical protein
MPETIFKSPKQKEDVVEVMKGLRVLGLDADEIAKWLNDAGMKTYQGEPWNRFRVRYILAYGI